MTSPVRVSSEIYGDVSIKKPPVRDSRVGRALMQGDSPRLGEKGSWAGAAETGSPASFRRRSHLAGGHALDPGDVKSPERVS